MHKINRHICAYDKKQYLPASIHSNESEIKWIHVFLLYNNHVPSLIKKMNKEIQKTIVCEACLLCSLFIRYISRYIKSKSLAQFTCTGYSACAWNIPTFFLPSIYVSDKISVEATQRILESLGSLFLISPSHPPSACYASYSYSIISVEWGRKTRWECWDPLLCMHYSCRTNGLCPRDGLGNL